LKDFKPCKETFIKFVGVIKDAGGTYLRVANETHGFDVFGLSKVDENLVGSKVTFSGYLDEYHVFNDDVVRGKIEAILMHADDVKAEELRAAAEKKAYEDTHPTCATNWMVCGGEIRRT
jgi:hypothetical protein